MTRKFGRELEEMFADLFLLFLHFSLDYYKLILEY